MKSIFFDTNSYSFYSLGDVNLRKQVKINHLVYISLITIGELYSGFIKGIRFKENEKKLEAFLNDKRVKLVKLTRTTALIYGKLMNQLYKKGKSIPTNDIWIAAQVVETGSMLVTYDKHFLEISNLKIWPELKS